MIGETFGFTNGIITMLALITGLYATKVTKIGVIGAILALLITDPLSDAYSMYTSHKLIDEKSAFDVGKKAFLTQAILQLFFLMIIIFSPTLKTGLIISYIFGISISIIYDRYKKIQLKDSIKNLSYIFILVILTYVIDKLVYKFFDK